MKVVCTSEGLGIDGGEVERIAVLVVALLKENNLTFAQALVVLEQSEAELQNRLFS